MKKEKSTAELQKELDELLVWFESDDVDLDDAVQKFTRGKEIIAELEKRLKTAENTIKTILKK